MEVSWGLLSWVLPMLLAMTPRIPGAVVARVGVVSSALGAMLGAAVLAGRPLGLVALPWFAVIAWPFIAGLSVWVQWFSVRHLRADPGQRRFVGAVNALTGASVGVVIAPSVLWFAVAWSAAGAALLTLLASGPASGQARSGIVRTGVALLVGDAALWAAVALLAAGSGGDIPWTRLAGSVTGLPVPVRAAAALLVAIAALSRSAQAPFHRWLPATLAAPTPVSAIMHAGVVNAATFLALRFAGVLTAVPAAMIVLLACGSFTMLAGAAGYLLNGDLKGRLVASTAAQMGFMVMTLGVGAWGAAVFHLIGHGIYKARLFLGAGGQIDRIRAAAGAPDALRTPSRGHRLGAMLTAAGVPGAAIALTAAVAGTDTSGLVLAVYGWIAAAVLAEALLTRTAWGPAKKALVVAGIAAGSAVYVEAVHAFSALIASDVPGVGWVAPGWVLLLPLALVALISLAPRLRPATASPVYALLSRIAVTPLRPLRARGRRRPAPTMQPAFVLHPSEELA
ncbi:proton-conducting transporter transmembrane domain-containing protein [Leifsonia sp. AG29]|uniref:proton-conducting transporter transmembrane domain-containing protein n=1 Tax=Leifsonia sp. AG29 TaxID=2598860 RepID=UPI00131BB2A4|nr:proton-conducting transporter membrane subunit [Leifsonia sp. AG29]